MCYLFLQFSDDIYSKFFGKLNIQGLPKIIGTPTSKLMADSRDLQHIYLVVSAVRVVSPRRKPPVQVLWDSQFPVLISQISDKGFANPIPS